MLSKTKQDWQKVILNCRPNHLNVIKRLPEVVVAEPSKPPLGEYLNIILEWYRGVVEKTI